MKGQRWARKHITRVIDAELRKALKRAPDDPELLAIAGSWHDTLSDAEVLRYLEDYNRTGKVIHTPQ